jgi:chromosome segregation ATPase
MSDPNFTEYWRSRAEHYAYLLTQAEESVAKLQEQLGDKNAMVSSLKARLKELEERCSQHV